MAEATLDTTARKDPVHTVRARHKFRGMRTAEHYFTVPLDLGRFVHTTGAVYAFAPSLSTLRLLGEDRSMRVG